MRYMLNLLNKDFELVEQRIVELPKVRIISELLLNDYESISPNFFFHQATDSYLTITKGV